MAFTSSTQIPTSVPTHYDVFLSFQSKDTGKGFTTNLYEALMRHGFQTFMDAPALRGGEIISQALLEAIKNSKTYIVVFSKNYGSSRWCLDELAEILKCFKEFGRLIIPVFYKVDPYIVGSQRSYFQTAFEKHEIRFAGEMEKVNNWRQTLRTVANFSGHHLGQTRSEVDTIKEVVDVVLRETKFMTLHVAKYPIGIDSHVAGITPWLTRDINGVHYVGIWGIVGVGKTTLAKAVFNANFRSFEGSSFLANVSEAFGQPKGPQGLLEQLIADVLKVPKIAINSVHQGMELVRQRLCSKKILIVVDDVNEQRQWDSLVVDIFAPGSVIILTTRHKDLLDRVGVKAKYQYMLKELDDADTGKLFNKHAFGNRNPSDKFLVLSRAILHHAGGLPLALEIFGSNLRNQPEKEWRRFIGELKEVVNSDIQKKLVISFESLVGPTLKEMFLDIVCFFVGASRKDVVPILGSCYEDVDTKIDRLISKSLIKTDEHNRFSMHDLVRDIGWGIARQFSGKEEFQKHTRVSNWEDIYKALDDNNDNKDIGTIECLVDHYEYDYTSSPGVILDTETFKRMPKLRFLKMRGVYLRGSFGQILQDLRWLHWYECPLQTIPFDFFPENLVILELRWSKITGWNFTKDLTNLKILDLSFSKELITLQNFRRFPRLEKLNLSHCEKLKKVDTTIGDLKNLVSLNLYHSGLGRLPNSICKLTALESLDIDHCDSLEALPEELGNMKSLTRLAVGSPLISKLPDSIIHLTNLVRLKLNLDSGRRITPFLERLPDLSNFKRLERLELFHCHGLTEIEGLNEIISIRKIHLEFCSGMTRLPNLSNLKHLETLKLSHCPSLTEIEGLEELNSIEYLDLGGCTSMKKLSNLSNLKRLETLQLTNCNSLTEIKGLEGLIRIQYIDLRGCDSTMLATTLTLTLFQRYSEFGNKIEIGVDPDYTPNWLMHLSFGCTEVSTNYSSHNFLGLLLYLDCEDLDYRDQEDSEDETLLEFTVNDETTFCYKSDKVPMMVIVPREYLIAASGSCDDNISCSVAAKFHIPDEMIRFIIGVQPLYKLPETT